MKCEVDRRLNVWEEKYSSGMSSQQLEFIID